MIIEESHIEDQARAIIWGYLKPPALGDNWDVCSRVNIELERGWCVRDSVTPEWRCERRLYGAPAVRGGPTRCHVDLFGIG